MDLLNLVCELMELAYALLQLPFHPTKLIQKPPPVQLLFGESFFLSTNIEPLGLTNDLSITKKSVVQLKVAEVPHRSLVRSKDNHLLFRHLLPAAGLLQVMQGTVLELGE